MMCAGRAYKALQVRFCLAKRRVSTNLFHVSFNYLLTVIPVKLHASLTVMRSSGFQPPVLTSVPCLLLERIC